jgi:hypothetical protein
MNACRLFFLFILFVTAACEPFNPTALSDTQGGIPDAGSADAGDGSGATDGGGELDATGALDVGLEAGRDGGGALDGSAPAETAVITVQVLYTTTANSQLEQLVRLGKALGETEMNGFLDALIAEVNGAYIASSIPGSFEVSDHRQINFSEIDEGWLEIITSIIINGSSTNLARRQMRAEIERMRDEAAADIVVFWRPLGDNEPRASGAAAIDATVEESFIQTTYFGMNGGTLTHELSHLLGARHEFGYIGSARYAIDDVFRQDSYRTTMAVTAETNAQGTPITSVRRLSSADAQLDGAIPCDVYEPVPNGAGTRRMTRVCTFNNASAGDVDHDSVSIISGNIERFSAFR